MPTTADMLRCRAMRKLVYYIAITADGFIAADDGSHGAFLMEGPHVPDMLADFPETLPTHVREALKLTAPNRCFDTVLMGRATYEIGWKQGVTSPYAHLEQYLFSTAFGKSPDPAVKLVSSDAAAFVRELKQRPGRDIWLCGGGQLAAALIGEIDELVLKLNPVVLGSGIKLFGAAVPPTQLKLTERRIYDNGYMRLHYAVA
jgi:dihydrofolate reductase